MNSRKYLLTIDPREVIGRYSALGEIQELGCNSSESTHVLAVEGHPETMGMDSEESIPNHLAPLYEQGKKQCEGSTQLRQFLSLLKRYQDVFSTGERDMGHTQLIEHSIPVIKDTKPVQLPPHRLGPQKEEKAERQVQDLLNRGLIEPANGTWSSPVVLVKKKDGT